MVPDLRNKPTVVALRDHIVGFFWDFREFATQKIWDFFLHHTNNLGLPILPNFSHFHLDST
jgi:hypothetical protein